MGIVVDVNVLRFPVSLKPVEVDALAVILTDVVANDDITIASFHDSAEPHIVVAVVVLNERIDAVVIGIKTTPVLSFLAQISIRLVISSVPS